MRAIAEYIKRFLIDNHPPERQLINVVMLRRYLESLENEVRARAEQEKVLFINDESQAAIELQKVGEFVKQFAANSGLEPRQAVSWYETPLWQPRRPSQPGGNNEQ